MQAEIITIGDELLIGQTIDTNSAWMAQELNKIGIWVHRRVAVGDVWKDIWQSLEEESNLSDIILITGGLGPTADDITKPLLCQYFGGKSAPCSTETCARQMFRMSVPSSRTNGVPPRECGLRRTIASSSACPVFRMK